MYSKFFLKRLALIPDRCSVIQVMASFAQRLTRAQASLPAPEQESIEHLTKENLKDEVMNFGKSHLGKTCTKRCGFVIPTGFDGLRLTISTAPSWNTGK